MSKKFVSYRSIVDPEELCYGIQDNDGWIRCICCGGATEPDESFDVTTMDKLPESVSMIPVHNAYTLHWMSQRGLSITDIFRELDLTDPCTSNEDLLMQFYERGFHGELFVSYDEFVDAEGTDPEYVWFLLSLLY